MPRSNTAARHEDSRLLTGKGNFVDDFTAVGCCHGYVVRSPYPHAIVESIDTAPAECSNGVLAVLTYADLVAENIGDLPCVTQMNNRDGTPIFKPPRPVLANKYVRYVGDPVAFVVADSLNNAMDAAELIDINFQELSSISNPEKALNSDTQIWSKAPNNVSFDWQANDAETTTQAMREAEHVVSIKVHHPRMAITPIEPRAALAQFDATNEQFVLYVQTQGVHMIRRVFAEDILKIPIEKLRVITMDVGGSFGMKIFPYPEYALVLVAARRTGRPVKWTASRSESFLSDAQGRARIDFAQLGLDKAGRFVALRVDGLADLGAYLSYVGPSIPSIYANTVIGHTYKIPNIHFRCRGVFTNAVPTDAYRGAGKPEMVSTLEQLIDKAALELKLDRIELRRMNFVLPEDLPFHMSNGKIIDSGNFPKLLDQVLDLSQWSNFRERRVKAQNKGLIRGIGLGMYMHSTGGSVTETSRVELNPNGLITVLTGTQAAGQGHETTLARIVAAALEISESRISVIQGDTDRIEVGGGTGGSSLVAIAGVTVQRAALRMLEQARQQAALVLEVSSADLEYDSGAFRVAGTDIRISLEQLATNLHNRNSSCIGQAEFDGLNTTHPSGAYVVEIECDPATGALTIVQLAGVDDVGRILNSELVDGQLHGSWAQSVGTSLMEQIEFDEDDCGHLLNGSLMDYQIPRADDLPLFNLGKLVTLCETNPLGIKGVGEVANLGAPGAIQNAISDLLTNQGKQSPKTAATPFRIWQALRMSSES